MNANSDQYDRDWLLMTARVVPIVACVVSEEPVRAIEHAPSVATERPPNA